NFDLLEWSVAIPSLAAQNQSPRPAGVGIETGHAPSQASLGEVFSSAVNPAEGFGGDFKQPLTAGSATGASLTLQVAGVPGTCTLSLADGVLTTINGQTQMEPPQPFTIVVSDP